MKLQVWIAQATIVLCAVSLSDGTGCNGTEGRILPNGGRPVGPSGYTTRGRLQKHRLIQVLRGNLPFSYSGAALGPLRTPDRAKRELPSGGMRENRGTRRHLFRRRQTGTGLQRYRRTPRPLEKGDCGIPGNLFTCAAKCKRGIDSACGDLLTNCATAFAPEGKHPMGIRPTSCAYLQTICNQKDDVTPVCKTYRSITMADKKP